jgi:hypothetical protein
MSRVPFIDRMLGVSLGIYGLSVRGPEDDAAYDRARGTDRVRLFDFLDPLVRLIILMR